MKTSLTAGIDIGGTKILAGIFSGGKNLLAWSKMPTGIEKKDRKLEDFIGAIENALLEALKKSGKDIRQLAGIGIGCAGQVELKTGDVLDAPHMPWKRMPIKSAMESFSGKPVLILNDVQSAAWGEFALGAGKKSRNMVCIFVGTGIGSGIIIEGHLYRGSAGCAGETGHIVFKHGGVKCKCGQRGCPEAYCGGESLWLRARSAIIKGHKTIIKDMVSSLDNIPASVIAKAAEKGDPLAKRLWKDAELALATVVHNYVNTLNPDTIVLGGGIVEGLPYLRDYVADYVMRRCVPTAARTVKIVAPLLGDKSGAVGAGNMAFRVFVKRDYRWGKAL